MEGISRLLNCIYADAMSQYCISTDQPRPNALHPLEYIMPATYKVTNEIYRSSQKHIITTVSSLLMYYLRYSNQYSFIGFTKTQQFLQSYLFHMLSDGTFKFPAEIKIFPVNIFGENQILFHLWTPKAAFSLVTSPPPGANSVKNRIRSCMFSTNLLHNDYSINIWSITVRHWTQELMLFLML